MSTVLAAMNGGLGDSLILSTLPELWLRERGERISITTINYPFRNEGIPDLVWRTNPFIDQVLPMGTVTTHVSLGKELNDLIEKYENNIMAHEAFFGFEPKNRYPRIYWQPTYWDAYRNTVVLDPSGVTMPYRKEVFEAHVNRKLDYIGESELVLLDTGKGTCDTNIFPDVPRLDINTIFELANIIYSCKAFISTESGATALASAIRGANPYPIVYGIISTLTKNNGIWAWENVKYSYTGQMTGDF